MEVIESVSIFWQYLGQEKKIIESIILILMLGWVSLKHNCHSSYENNLWNQFYLHHNIYPGTDICVSMYKCI